DFRIPMITGRFSVFEKLRAQAKSSKFQTPSSKEAPSSKLKSAPFAPASVLGVWCFEIWNFSGAWGLVLGVSLGGGSKTEMRDFFAFRHPDLAMLLLRFAAGHAHEHFFEAEFIFLEADELQ